VWRAVRVLAGALLDEGGDPQGAAEVRKDLGRAGATGGRTDGLMAVCDARRVLSGGNDFFWTHLMVGRCEDARGRTDEAVAAAAAATRLKPDYALAYNEMGMRFGYWRARGEGARSVELLQQAARLEPTSGIFRVNLAIAHQHEGRTADAVRESRAAARLLPREPEVQQQLGRALEEAGDLAGALAAYSEAVAVSRAGGGTGGGTGGEAWMDGVHEDAFCAAVNLRVLLCRWAGVDAAWGNQLDADMAALSTLLRTRVLARDTWGGTCDQPFRLFSYPLPATLLTQLSRHVASKERRLAFPAPPHRASAPPLPALLPPGPGRAVDPRHSRLRVAYLSSDLGGHTVGSLVRGLFRAHDARRVEVLACELRTEAAVRRGAWRTEMQRNSAAWLSLERLPDTVPPPPRAGWDDTLRPPACRAPAPRLALPLALPRALAHGAPDSGGGRGDRRAPAARAGRPQRTVQGQSPRHSPPAASARGAHLAWIPRHVWRHCRAAGLGPGRIASGDAFSLHRNAALPPHKLFPGRPCPPLPATCILAPYRSTSRGPQKRIAVSPDRGARGWHGGWRLSRWGWGGTRQLWTNVQDPAGRLRYLVQVIRKTRISLTRDLYLCSGFLLLCSCAGTRARFAAAVGVQAHAPREKHRCSDSTSVVTRRALSKSPSARLWLFRFPESGMHPCPRCLVPQIVPLTFCSQF
jgi:hypothetical protein